MVTRLLKWLLYLLVVVCVFDPENLLLGIKTYLFLGIIATGIIHSILNGNSFLRVPTSFLLYTYLFAIVLPLTSLCIYAVFNGDYAFYDGFQMSKSYLFIILALVLIHYDIDLLPAVIQTLLIVSALTIFIYVLLTLYPALEIPIYAIGKSYKIFALARRSYGPLTYTTMYFSTAPLLIIALAKHTHDCVARTDARFWTSAVQMVVVATAMVISGTRNSIFLCALVLAAIVLVDSPHRRALVWLVFLTVLVTSFLAKDLLTAMLSAEDYSNKMKLVHLQDYYELLGDPLTIIFGQGLGAFFFSSARQAYVSITELTYLEIFRSYGFVVGLGVLALLCIPASCVFRRRYRSIRYLTIAYIGYLLMAVTNPFVFSSSGMLLLCVLLYWISVTGALEDVVSVRGAGEARAQRFDHCSP